MKHYILPLLAVCLCLTACRDFFDKEELSNTGYRPTDIRTSMSYALTDDDISTIGKQCTYKGKDTIPSIYEQKALSLCTAEDSTAYTAWKRIAAEKALNEDADADIYVPMLMAQKFPYLDAGTICQVTYPLYEGKSARQQAFKNISAYTLTETDYRTIWGGRGASYLNEEKEPDLAAFLQQTFPTATEGKLMLITYQYDDITPDTIYPPLNYECTVAELLAAQETTEHQLTGTVGIVRSTIYGRFYLRDGNDSIYVYGLNDENGNRVWKDKGIQQGDEITVKGKYAMMDDEPVLTGAVYVSHQTPNASLPKRIQKATIENHTKQAVYQLQNGTWTLYDNDQLYLMEILPQSIYNTLGMTNINNPEEVIGGYLNRTYPYAQAKQIYMIVYYGANGLTADEWTYNGTDFILNTGYVTEKMSFVLNNDWLANISTYYTTPFVGDGQADFTIQHVALDGLNYVWRYQASYGMTASGYVSGTNHPVEDWLISPKIRLKKSQHPRLTFDHAVRYGNELYNKEWLKVMVTNDFTGDVTTTEWQHLAFPDSIPDGSNWVFLNTGDFDLSQYNGETITIAFCYNTTTGELTSAPTWEIQHMLVYEPDDDE